MKIHSKLILTDEACILGTARANEPTRSQATQAAVEAWKDLRFGMFIHWGPVSLTGKEIGWSRGRETPIEEYDNLYKKFNPVDFKADEWVAVAKAAGMKYIVLTTRHHDGFCLWPSDYTDYNIAATPFKRDVVCELAAACRKQGLGFGTYYSTLDWWHPDYPKGSPAGETDKPNPNMPRYIEYTKAQSTELVTKYGPLTCMWFDMPREVTEADNEPTVEALHKLQPDLMINNRPYQAKGTIADFDTPEQKIGGFNRTRPWESCMTISAHNHWAWSGVKDGVKSLQACLRMLILASAGDGNMLLNVGPRADGVIDSEQANRLKEMGEWLKTYGEGIYRTSGGPFKPGKWGGATCRDNKIYLFVMLWDDNSIKLPPIDVEVKSATALSGGKLEMTQTADGITLTLPKDDHKEIATVIELTIDGNALDVEPVDVTVICRSGSLAYDKKATAANVYRNEAKSTEIDEP